MTIPCGKMNFFDKLDPTSFFNLLQKTIDLNMVKEEIALQHRMYPSSVDFDSYGTIKLHTKWVPASIHNAVPDPRRLYTKSPCCTIGGNVNGIWNYRKTRLAERYPDGVFWPKLSPAFMRRKCECCSLDDVMKCVTYGCDCKSCYLIYPYLRTTRPSGRDYYGWRHECPKCKKTLIKKNVKLKKFFSWTSAQWINQWITLISTC